VLIRDVFQFVPLKFFLYLYFGPAIILFENLLHYRENFICFVLCESMPDKHFRNLVFCCYSKENMSSVFNNAGQMSNATNSSIFCG
jgi:hypothetical protein